MNLRQQIDQPIATCARFLSASLAVATCLKVFTPALKALGCKACTAAFRLSQDHLHSGNIAYPSCACRESSSAALTAISALNSEEASRRAASSSLAFPACFASAASFLAKAACMPSAGTESVRIEA